MKDEDFKIKFPWWLAFIVSGLCCFGFIGFMNVLNSSSPPIFLWIGIGALSTGVLLGITSLFFKRKGKTSVHYPGKNRSLLH